jgi:hypothetical protein
LTAEDLVDDDDAASRARGQHGKRWDVGGCGPWDADLGLW